MKSHESGNNLVRKWMSSLNIFSTLGHPAYETKRIIEGKTYNTKTATLLASFSYDKTFEQYKEFWEDLYQTKSGKFFLMGEGMSGYTPYGAEIPGCNEYVRGHALIPLEISQVKKWLEIRNLVDEYEEIFGEPEEAGESSSYTFTLRLPVLLSQKLKESCEEKESIQSFIQKSIESEIARRRKQEEVPA
jgi:hypothetical protein